MKYHHINLNIHTFSHIPGHSYSDISGISQDIQTKFGLCIASTLGYFFCKFRLNHRHINMNFRMLKWQHIPTGNSLFCLKTTLAIFSYML